MIGIYSITLMHIILYYGRNVAVDLLDRYLDCQKINWTLEFLVNDGWKKKVSILEARNEEKFKWLFSNTRRNPLIFMRLEYLQHSCLSWLKTWIISEWTAKCQLPDEFISALGMFELRWTHDWHISWFHFLECEVQWDGMLHLSICKCCTLSVGWPSFGRSRTLLPLSVLAY